MKRLIALTLAFLGAVALADNKGCESHVSPPLMERFIDRIVNKLNKFDLDITKSTYQVVRRDWRKGFGIALPLEWNGNLYVRNMTFTGPEITLKILSGDSNVLVPLEEHSITFKKENNTGVEQLMTEQNLYSKHQVLRKGLKLLQTWKDNGVTPPANIQFGVREFSYDVLPSKQSVVPERVSLDGVIGVTANLANLNEKDAQQVMKDLAALIIPGYPSIYLRR